MRDVWVCCALICCDASNQYSRFTADGLTTIRRNVLLKLNSVHLTNYRCHRDLKVEFGLGFNVVVGVNGSGKTSLLKALCDSLDGFAHFVQMHNGPQHQPMSEDGVARVEVDTPSNGFRFEPCYPVKVEASGEAFSTPFNWTLTKVDQIVSPGFSGNPPGQGWLQIQNASGSGGPTTKASTSLPLIAFYRADRNWKHPQPSEFAAATLRNARSDGYTRWWDASLDSSSLQIWAIAKCLERFQTSSETGALFDAIQDDELALVNSALSLGVEGAKGLRYDLKQKSLLVEWNSEAQPSRTPTAFQNLSDGQRAVTGLIADIARRMCILNPHLGPEVIRKTSGIVLIDELDMHLHPKWQRIVTKGLKEAFPSIQFIVTSHSPQVLGELEPCEIILLRPQGTAHPQVSYGLDSSRVLEEIMDTGARSEEVGQDILQLFEALERNELGVARAYIDKLKRLAPGVAELAGAEALLKRKEVLGR